MIEVKVKNIGLDSITGSPIIMLANIENEDEIFPIWIGVPEAEGILLNQSGIKTPRPLTYDLMKSIIEMLGGTVKQVAVVDKKDNTYIAEIVIEKGGEEVVIDARPSDAINIAIRFGAPIYVDEKVVQKISMKELIKGKENNSPHQLEEKREEHEDKELEEFRKMLENIKPKDFALKPENKKKD